MEKLFQAIYGGILYGSIYGLMAIGLTLIWGSFRMLNMAHGSLYIVGGYLSWTALNIWNLPPMLALIVGVLAAALVGLVIQIVLINRLLGRQSFFNAAMIATVGAAIVIEAAALLIYGPRVKQMPPIVVGQINLFGVVIEYHGLVIIFISIVSLIMLSLFLSKTRYGLAIQAVSQQVDAARLMGIPVVTTFAIVMAISAGLAGLAGALLSSIFYIAPTAGFNPMVKALVVTIFGGLGSVKGTVWAAFVIGLLEAFLQVYLGAGWALPGLFLFMILMLIIRPTGLFGLGEMQRL
ncbi:MAG: branched-chain amino acid ABC transporter permease [Anaerolineae bacterium]|nr:branched-chain amino acid ABC transporter permease [Anaerolineae bacterium]